MNTIGNYLRGLRSQRGLTLRDVTKRSGVSHSYLSQVETGKIAQPSPHVLRSLASAYGVAYHVLLAEAGYLQESDAVRDLREGLADLQHRIWSHWMRYLFSQGTLNPDGTWTMPAWAVERWQRQMTTRYEALTPEEQASDQHEADKVIAVVFSRDGLP